MSASHPQAHIGLPAICTAKLVIIYLKTIIFIKNIARSGIFQMQAERVCYNRRSRFAHHRLICNLPRVMWLYSATIQVVFYVGGVVSARGASLTRG